MSLEDLVSCNENVTALMWPRLCPCGSSIGDNVHLEMHKRREQGASSTRRDCKGRPETVWRSSNSGARVYGCCS
ncbi:hypothetical protein HBI13_040980 [Parastagonospora nodorum]|nr:hypothetical protein HBI10_061410 [Parastagonospora nodorum]KAH4028834.1 hypothetical protein HBI13_040980 [Parastagonospora nodorum]